MPSAGEDVERQELSLIAGGSAKWCYRFERQVGGISQNQVQSNLGSRTSWFLNNSVLDQVVDRKKTPWLSNKILGLDSLAGNSFMQIPLWSAMYLSDNKQRGFGFQTNRFSNCFPEWIKFQNQGSTSPTIQKSCSLVLTYPKELGIYIHTKTCIGCL